MDWPPHSHSPGQDTCWKDSKTPKPPSDEILRILKVPPSCPTPNVQDLLPMMGTFTPMEPGADTLGDPMQMYHNLQQEVQGEGPMVLESS